MLCRFSGAVPVPFNIWFNFFPLIVVGSDRHIDRLAQPLPTALDEVDYLSSSVARDKCRLSTASGVSELNRGFMRSSMGSSVPSHTPSPNNISVR